MGCLRVKIVISTVCAVIVAFRLMLTNDHYYKSVIRCIAHMCLHCYVQLLSDRFIVTARHKIAKLIVVCYEILR